MSSSTSSIIIILFIFLFTLLLIGTTTATLFPPCTDVTPCPISADASSSGGGDYVLIQGVCCSTGSSLVTETSADGTVTKSCSKESNGIGACRKRMEGLGNGYYIFQNPDCTGMTLNSTFVKDKCMTFSSGAGLSTYYRVTNCNMYNATQLTYDRGCGGPGVMSVDNTNICEPFGTGSVYVSCDSSFDTGCSKPSSPTYMCIRYNKAYSYFSIDSGTGFRDEGSVTLNPGTSYTFEVSAIEAFFQPDLTWSLSTMSSSDAVFASELALPNSIGTWTGQRSSGTSFIRINDKSPRVVFTPAKPITLYQIATIGDQVQQNVKGGTVRVTNVVGSANQLQSSLFIVVVAIVVSIVLI